MKKITLAGTALLLLSTIGLFAQTQPESTGAAKFGDKFPGGAERCGTILAEKYLSGKYPGLTYDNFQKTLEPGIEQARQKLLEKDGNQVLSFPIVVHVIHDGDQIGTDENINDGQILSQLTVLNQDYRKLLGSPGYNENLVGADVAIEFCLAKTDPHGQPTTGIVRHNLGQAVWGLDDIEVNIKSVYQWDVNKYINVYVLRMGDDLAQVAGYSYFPIDSPLEGFEDYQGLPASFDGICIQYLVFGSEDLYPQGNYFPGLNKGRTLTHEMGHYFGLSHIWGDQDNCVGTDYVDDTPTSATPHYSCGPDDSCLDSPGADMIENYLDYTPDACMNIFTMGQKTRIHAAIASSAIRTSQSTSDRCSATASIQDNSLKASLSVYPNPTESTLYIASELLEDKAGYVMYNSLGQHVISGDLNVEHVNAINIEQLTNGVYFIKITSGESNTTFKVIKQ
jgi:hypothetical protein